MKYVYAFHEGSQDMRDLLGGKGANLAEMTRISLPVPKGFTVTTEACLKYYQNQESLNADIISEIYEKINELERLSGKKMGDPSNPLLVSVRSGSRVSMPGMMDTILNLGMNDVVAEGFSKISSNPRFVYDNYRRLIQMYADVVMGFPKSSFEHLFDKIKEEKNVTLDTELTADDLKEIVEIYNIKNVSVIDKAVVPSSPYNMNIIKQLVLTILVALVLSCGDIFVLFYFDTSIKSVEEVEQKVGLPILGSVPDSLSKGGYYYGK